MCQQEWGVDLFLRDATSIGMLIVCWPTIEIKAEEQQKVKNMYLCDQTMLLANEWWGLLQGLSSTLHSTSFRVTFMLQKLVWISLSYQVNKMTVCGGPYIPSKLPFKHLACENVSLKEMYGNFNLIHIHISLHCFILDVVFLVWVQTCLVLAFGLQIPVKVCWLWFPTF